MYLLLAAHPDGAALQELTQAGHPQPANAEPRVVARGDLAAVVRELETRQRPRWIWHRTQDWYPDLLAAGVELERCYDLSLCGNILAFWDSRSCALRGRTSPNDGRMSSGSSAEPWQTEADGSR